MKKRKFSSAQNSEILFSSFDMPEVAKHTQKNDTSYPSVAQVFGQIPVSALNFVDSRFFATIFYQNSKWHLPDFCFL